MDDDDPGKRKNSQPDWREAIEAWRRLPPEEKLRRRFENIPESVAQSMAFAGEPVDIEMLRREHREFMQKHYHI